MIEEEEDESRDCIGILLRQFEPLDFDSLIYSHEVPMLRNYIKYIEPESEEANEILERLTKLNRKAKIKITRDDYLKAITENISRIATESPWDICKFQGSICIDGNGDYVKIEINEFKKFLGEASEKMGVPEFTAKDPQFIEQFYKQFFDLYEPEYKLFSIDVNDGTIDLGD